MNSYHITLAAVVLFFAGNIQAQTGNTGMGNGNSAPITGNTGMNPAINSGTTSGAITNGVNGAPGSSGVTGTTGINGSVYNPLGTGTVNTDLNSQQTLQRRATRTPGAGSNTMPATRRNIPVNNGINNGTGVFNGTGTGTGTGTSNGTDPANNPGTSSGRY